MANSNLRNVLCLAALAGLLSSSTGRVLADLKPDDQKDKKEEKAPDAAGHGDAEAPEQENPFPELVEMMRKAEEALAEAEAGSTTQAAQRAIADALKGQGDTSSKLTEFIRQMEQQSEGGGGEGGESSESDKSGQSGKKRSKPRGQDGGKRSSNPQQGQRQGQQPQGQKKPDSSAGQQSESSEKQRKVEETQLPPAAAAQGPKHSGDAGRRWGDLPMKQAREVLDARKREMPERYREQLERYFRRIAGPEQR